MLETNYEWHTHTVRVVRLNKIVCLFASLALWLIQLPVRSKPQHLFFYLLVRREKSNGSIQLTTTTSRKTSFFWEWQANSRVRMYAYVGTWQQVKNIFLPPYKTATLVAVVLTTSTRVDLRVNYHMCLADGRTTTLTFTEGKMQRKIFWTEFYSFNLSTTTTSLRGSSSSCTALHYTHLASLLSMLSN